MKNSSLIPLHCNFSIGTKAAQLNDSLCAELDVTTFKSNMQYLLIVCGYNTKTSKDNISSIIIIQISLFFMYSYCYYFSKWYCIYLCITLFISVSTKNMSKSRKLERNLIYRIIDAFWFFLMHVARSREHYSRVYYISCNALHCLPMQYYIYAHMQQ